MNDTNPTRILLLANPTKGAKSVGRILRQTPIKYLLAQVSKVKEAQENLKKKTFDLAIVALEDEKSIHETIVAARSANPTVAIIVLSPTKSQQLTNNFLGRGAHEHLSCPELTPTMLANAIRYAMDRNQLETRVQEYADQLEQKNEILENLVIECTDELTCREKLFSSIVNLAPVGIVRFDHNGYFCFANTKFEKMFNYEPRDLVGTKFSQLIHPADRQTTAKKLLAVSQKPLKPIDITRKILDKTGIPITCAIKICCDQNNEKKNFIAIIEDVSEKARREKLIRDKIVAERSNRAKSEFLANISHEIRTPLSAVFGFLELAMRTNDQTDRTEYLSLAMKNGKHLYSIVNDILDLSKVESGHVDVEKSHVSLRQEIDSVIETIRASAAKDKQLHFKLLYSQELPQAIETDAPKLRQILINLLNNSVKYTESGMITLEAKPGKNQTIQITVADTGVGIDHLTVKHLFQPFSRGCSEKIQKKEGAGIGLALSKSLARLLGGDLVLLSTGKTGTKFLLTIRSGDASNLQKFQLKTAKEPKITAKVTSHDDLRGFKVLLVEDQPDLQILVRHYLENHGGRVLCCGDGRTAIQMAMSTHVDCILMDIQIPEINGLDATKTLRQMGYQGKIIALTAHAFQESRHICLEGGFDGYITKPATERQMIDGIQQVCRPAGPRQESKTSSNPDPLMKEATALFLSNLKDIVPRLRRGVETENWEEVAKLAHQIKGSSSCYGFNRLTDISNQIEQAAKSPLAKSDMQAKVINLSNLTRSAIQTLA